MRLPFLWNAQNLIKPDIQNLLSRFSKIGEWNKKARKRGK